MSKRKKFKKRHFISLNFKVKDMYSRYEKAYKTLAVLGICSFVSSVVYTVFYRTENINALCFALLLGYGMVWGGYFISAFFGLLTATKRVKTEYTYEKTEKYYSFAPMALSSIAAFVLAVVAGKTASDRNFSVTSGGLVIRDTASLIPFIVFAAFFVCIMIGICLWFRPYNKILTSSNAFPFGGGFIVIAFAGIIYFGTPMEFVTVQIIVYIFCVLVVLSQGYLIKIIDESGTGTATSEVRKYNLSASMLAFLSLALIGILASSVIVGIVVLGRFLFKLLVLTITGSDGYIFGQTAGSVGYEITEEVFDGILGIESQTAVVMLFIIFLLMLCGAIVLFATRRKLKRKGKRFPTPKKIFLWFYNLILRCIETLFAFLRGKRAWENYALLEDYADEALKMDHDRHEDIPDVSTKNGMRRFDRMYAACKDDAERLALCYRMSRGMYIKADKRIKCGDTPEVMSKKVKNFFAPREAERFAELSRAYSASVYAGIPPNSDDMALVWEEIAFRKM